MKKTVSLLLIWAIYFSLIMPVGVRLAGSANAQTVGGRALSKKNMEDIPDGLTFRLSEGEEGVDKRVRPVPAQADPLSGGETADLLGRLPAITTEEDDRKDFAKRAGSLPPPKTGKKIPVKFPADEDRPAPPGAAPDASLEVVRYSPEGEVNLAPDLSVTFSQPMVAVTSQEEAARRVPVEMTPAAKGKWRWLGTKTLMFDTDQRFPMATRFSVRVPAGTRSATGQTLEKEVAWNFTTPPPKAELMIPQSQITRRDAPMFVRFDQRIDPGRVIETISVTSGGKKLPIRLLTADEINGSNIEYYVKQAEPGRWIAFRAVNPAGGTEDALPADAPIKVTINQGTPSAEGPLTTREAQSYGFRTYGAMKFVKGFCNYERSKTCTPFDTWLLRFTNPIDASKFDRSMVRIEPAVEGLNIYPSGQYLYIQGYKKGRTSYRVSVADTLTDTFGQTLQEPAVARFDVGSAPPNLYAQGGSFIVLDPTAKPSFSIYSINHKTVKVRLYKVEPADWYQFSEYLRRINYDDDTKRPAIPGRLVVDQTVAIESRADEMVETRVDLSKALTGGLGNVVIDIEPTVKRDKYDRTRLFKWAQRTNIGLDAFVDNEELIGMATDLKTGRPLSGVELSIYPNGAGLRGAPVSRKQKEEKSFFTGWWDWLTSWGQAEDRGGEISTVDENGADVETVSIEPAQTNRTGSSGVLRLPLPQTAADRQNMLIARLGNDTAFLPEYTEYYYGQGRGNWYRKSTGEYLRWFVFDDRKMYRPKEEVSVKGYIRRISGGKLGDVLPLGDAAAGLDYRVFDPRGNEIAKGTANLNAFGAFDLQFKLPDNANLGNARVQLSTRSALSGKSYYHNFQIQEFRRPEFEVAAKNETEAPYLVGEMAKVSVEAKYYAGGGLANADVNWTVRAMPTNYTPPNRGDFTFGKWVPWWYHSAEYYGSGGTTKTFKGVTDAAGKHILQIDFESVKPPRPYNVTASAAVQDVNRQTWSSTTSLLVHPADLYIGIRTPRPFVKKGEQIRIESIVADIDGKLIAGRDAEIKAVLKTWVFDKGKWEEKIVDQQECQIRSAAEPAECVFTAKQGGRYTITATVMDDRERFNESEFTVWVAGGKTPPSRSIEQERAEIIPDKKEYAPGETAEILVISPFAPAEGILTLRREGIVKTERFTIKDSSLILKIPIEEKYLPNIHAQVDLVGAAERAGDDGEVKKDLARRPAFAVGDINLPVSTASRELSVEAEPADKTLEPGGTTRINVAVRGRDGAAAAGTEVAVVVVDESVLALTNYQLANPLSTFYTQRGEGVSDYHLRKDVLLANPEDVGPPADLGEGQGEPAPTPAAPLAKQARARTEAADVVGLAMEEKEMDAGGEGPIDLRRNFDALARFAPSVRTDGDGRATVEVKLPDNLTRYRVMAVAVDQGKRFGKGESNITARKPLMVRPSAPRFMNFGDRIELPVVVQNQTDEAMTVNVGVRASNANLTAGGGRRVTVPANDRVEVRFPVDADKAGTARFQFAVSAGRHTDAAEIELPVWTPATTEAFATYGTTGEDGSIVQPVQAPADVYPQFGGLEVTTSSTQLQELTDAFIYLYRYPFECTEQVASRMISIAALQDVLEAFKAEEMPAQAELKASFAKDMKILRSRQNANGYFGMWRQTGERWKYPFVTVHTAHALHLAKQKGYDVPPEVIERVKPYLKDVEKHYDNQWYSERVRWTISAYALYVRNLMGDNDAAKARKLLAEATVEKMPFEALGWIMSVLVDAKDAASAAEVEKIKRFLLNRTAETAATAQFNTDYGDGAWLIMHSNRRADAVLLEAFLKADQDNDLIPKLVRGLLAHRTKGRWANTQENVFVLLALDKYFQAYEKVTPNFVTRVWLGTAYAGEQKFIGRSVDSNQLEIPMSYLVDQGGLANLILDKRGAGRLYYRIGMKYAPKSLNLKPADYGFTVLRTYEAVDDAEDVMQNADGKWVIKAGARVRVNLTMVAQARRYHVALVDPLPAGLEILNPGLAVTEEIPPAGRGGNTPVIEYGSRSYGRGYYSWRARWFEHQNFRDERAEAFAGLLWSGVYNYTYVARATTPGEFVVPPAKAEEMYHPETFGRTGTDFVRVE